MKKIKFTLTAVAIITGVFGAYASASFADEIYQVTAQGGSGSSQYWILGQNVTTYQPPGTPGTYICVLSANVCTAETDESKIINTGSQLIVLKSDATTTLGTFTALP